MDIGDIIRETLIEHLGDTYDCTRVWEAWSYGTMSDSDFIPVNDRIDDIVEAVILAMQENRIEL